MKLLGRWGQRWVHRAGGCLGMLVGWLVTGLIACSVPPLALSRPNGIALAADGTLYVVDRAHYRVVHLTPTGKFLGAFGQLGTGPADLFSPWDVAVAENGQRYVCNKLLSNEGVSLADGIKVYAPSGQWLKEIGGQVYEHSNQIRHAPTGLALDGEGRLYVADLGTNTVRVFDPGGRLLARFFGSYGEKPGEFRDLIDVAVDSERGLLYAVDSINGRYQQFTLALDAGGVPTVTLRSVVGSYGRGPGQFSYPQAVAVDSRTGRVYIADMGNQRLQAFDVEGVLQAEYRPPTVAVWQVMGLAVGPEGTVYATDAFNNLIWAFDPETGTSRQLSLHR